MFKFIHISGRALSKNEEDLLDRIDQHSVTGFPLLRDLHNQVSVEIHDKKDEYKTVEVDIDALIKEEMSLQDRWVYIREHDNSNERGKKLDEIGDLICSVEKAIKTAKNSCDGVVDMTIEKLGEFEYNNQHPLGTIRLFIDNIGYDSHRLASTYVHEMMHAYFATRASNNIVTEIEEAIVECCTLRFLYSFYGETKDFSRILTEVKKKKYSLGLGYYGFGAFLYENAQMIPWLDLYRNANSRIDARDYDVISYIVAFKKGYPYKNEAQTTDTLYTILRNASGMKGKTNIWGKRPRINGVPLNCTWKKAQTAPQWAYDKKNRTLCFDGFWDSLHLHIFLSTIQIKMQSGMQVEKIYLGEHFMSDDNFYALNDFMHSPVRWNGVILMDKKNILAELSGRMINSDDIIYVSD